MIEYFLLALGLILLTKGADYLVEGSSSLAKKLGVSTLVIGLTIVAFGTSLPELIINTYASLQGSAAVSYGNIIGSSVANILLILGLAAIIYPIRVKESTVWKEMPFALFAAVLLMLLSNKLAWGTAEQDVLTRLDGIVLLFFFVTFIYYVFSMVIKDKKYNAVKAEPVKHSNMVIFFMILGGITALFIGGKITVDGAVTIAINIGISEFLISATIVAIGSSLPELVTSVVAAIKKERDLSVGNIVGSNIFNLLLVMGVSSAISPMAVPFGVNFDFTVLIGATLFLFFFMFIGDKKKITKFEAAVFLLAYISYIWFIIVRG